MSAHANRTSFSGLTSSEAVVYIDALVQSQTDGGLRRQAISHIQQLIDSDLAAQRQTQTVLMLARKRLRQINDESTFDFQESLTGHLTIPATTIQQRIDALLATNNAHIFIPAGTTYTGDLNVSADHVTIECVGATGVSTDSTLVTQCTVAGCLRVTGDYCTVRGVKFNTANDRDGVAFPTACTGLKLVNCEFDGTRPAAAESRFWYGVNYAAGPVHVEGCTIKNYNSWLLMDANTGSSVPTTRLTTCKLLNCRFENCSGSIAWRGTQADPSALAEFVGNVFQYGTSQHTSFWSGLEANNFRRVVVKKNTATGARFASNERGFFQGWSRAGNWTLQMSQNTISGFDYVAQIACSATFYAPDSEDDRYRLKSETGAITDTLYGATFVYPWDSGVYAPENSGRFPALPPTDWASGLANRQT